ncbi:Penicillin-binding protein 4* [anaerobic digester metagenome]
MEHTIRSYCEAAAENELFSGACLVKQGNQVIYQGSFGLAHRGYGIPNRLDTRFDIASVTKLFTAAAVLRLAQEGTLRLEDRISDLISLEATEIPNNVTLYHLLTHTSGIADDADEEAGESYSDLFITKPNYSIRTTRDFLPQFAYKPPVFSAGTAVRYNNCAFVLLGLAIEAVTGRTYRDFVQTEIFDRLGMDRSGFFAMDGIDPDVAEGYIDLRDQQGMIIGWKKNIYSYPPIGSPDGGAYSTVTDLDRFLRKVHFGELLNPTYTDLFQTPRIIQSRPYRWSRFPDATIRNGFGFEFIESGETILCLRKDGMNEGVAAMAAYYPQADRSIVLLANQGADVWALHRKIQDLLFDQSGTGI